MSLRAACSRVTYLERLSSESRLSTVSLLEKWVPLSAT